MEKQKAGERSAASTASAAREIVESIVIAFVLAFLFRTFEAEAFVIPTGSMASTLMGRHKDLICEKCGFPFQASASDEINSDTNRRYPDNRSVVSATCPNCRHTMYVGPDARSESHPSYKGDRILVAKFPYRFSEPQRWDVAVFKYPGEARTNFIKRLVGLPGETVRIEHGDLFIKNGDRDGWKIARKPLDKVRAMMRMVYDNDYVQEEIVSGVWPARWSGTAASDPFVAPPSGGREPAEAGTANLSAAAGWTASKDLQAFRTSGEDEGEAWLHYEHRVPSWEDWDRLKRGARSPDPLRPQLITDFTAYNTKEVRPVYGRDNMYDVPPPNWQNLGLHWVGDLAVECELVVLGEGGEAVFELVEGGRRFQCRFDLATGRATLGIDGREDFAPSAATAVCGPGEYRIFFANFDDQLYVAVDGDELEFDAATTFGPLGNDRPTVADLAPVRIGSAGAGLEVRHLKVYRDIHYIAEKVQGYGFGDGGMTDYKYPPFPYHYPVSRQEVARVLSDPRQWGPLAASRGSVQFALEADQFLVFGDNSAESKDSRLWGREHYVSRELLIGKALVIYWPHSLHRIPGTPIPIRFFPNFWRMGFVR